MADTKCVCGQQTGRICPVHPERGIEWRTMHGSPPSEATVPYVADGESDEHDAEWANQLAARTENLAGPKAVVTLAPGCPDCRFNDPCFAHAGGSC